MMPLELHHCPYRRTPVPSSGDSSRGLVFAAPTSQGHSSSQPDGEGQWACVSVHASVPGGSLGCCVNTCWCGMHILARAYPSTLSPQELFGGSCAVNTEHSPDGLIFMVRWVLYSSGSPIQAYGFLSSSIKPYQGEGHQQSEVKWRDGNVLSK